MAVSPTKFEILVTDIAAGTHANVFNASTDVVALYATNAAPSASLDTQKSELPTETTGTGYSNADIANTTSTASGTITVDAGATTVLTASAADWTALQYIALYNETSTNDDVIMFYDYGSSITVGNGETFTFGVPTTLITMT